MEKWLNRFSILVVATVLTAMVWPPVDDLIVASPIKNWASNEYIRYSDLNNVVNHLHASVGHGHGAIITANDIASNAGIRPEQTTFGSSINRSLVHIGSYLKNPDGGTAYLPLNYSGDLAVTVTSNASGFSVAGAAAAGANPDGGSVIYTTFATASGYNSAAATLCYEGVGSTTLSSPLTHDYLCQTIASLSGAASYLSPSAVSLLIYSNEVQ